VQVELLKKKIINLNKVIDLLRKALGLQTQAEKLETEAMVRRTASEYGVDPDVLVAVIWAESGMNPRAIHRNQNGTTDYGLCQFNDYWYKDVISPEEALKKPEKAVRVMCEAWQKGRANDWVAFRTKKYLAYLKP